jgi:eukaryotic-like serine/threonine-protein kinase
VDSRAITTDAAAVKLQLERVLRSRPFEKAQRSQRFLRYIVEAALNEDWNAVKEYAIALKVFDRDDSYDPSIDATVRVEASRLRSRLREYYAEEGKDDRLIIEVPRGGYAVVFSERPSTPVLGPASISADITSPVAVRRKWLTWTFAATLSALSAVAGVALYSRLHHPPLKIKYTQLTDFTDSAVSPALSPDGQVIAFIRGDKAFLTPDQIYAKVLPSGEAKRLTTDPRPKYGIAFSHDGSQIAYSVVAEPPRYVTYTVPILGGDPHLFLNDAAGLTWLDQHQLLFSQIHSGVHMGIVTATDTRDKFRELYFPAHERGMAHYSYASPNRDSALVVEMDGAGHWAPCRIISLQTRFQSRLVGPAGPCTSAGWSPDGSWMFFTAKVEGQSHIWRERVPSGEPEQITFGPTEEDGVAVENDGRSVITSMGVHESAIWIHDAGGDRSLSSEGEVLNYPSPPSFNTDATTLFYLLRHGPAAVGPELWRMSVNSGQSEPVFPGVAMLAYDVSPDGKQVLYSTAASSEKSQLWLAPIDRSSPAKRIGYSGEVSPHFGPTGKILFELAEGNSNYLEQMNQDGLRRSKVVPYAITDFHGVSPARRWVTASVRFAHEDFPSDVAIPLNGGSVKRLCSDHCVPNWSPDGRFLFLPLETSSRTSLGRSLAIPIGPGESLPDLPPGGITPRSTEDVVPGSHIVNRANFVPGNDLNRFAYVNTTMHRNLYRISLP